MTPNIRQRLIDFFANEHSIQLFDSDFNEIESILSPPPPNTQGAKTKEDLEQYALSIYKEPLNKRGEERARIVGQSIPFGFRKWFSAFKKGVEFADLQCYEKDREIEGLKKENEELKTALRESW